MPDNFVKHLVLPRMSSEVTTWLTYLSEDLNIITKTYLIDPEESNIAPGTLAVSVNKVNPQSPMFHSREANKATRAAKRRHI